MYLPEVSFSKLTFNEVSYVSLSPQSRGQVPTTPRGFPRCRGVSPYISIYSSITFRFLHDFPHGQVNSGTDEVSNNSGFLAHDDVTPSILNIACTKKKCLSFLPHQLWHTMLLHGCDIVTLLKKTTNKKSSNSLQI